MLAVAGITLMVGLIECYCSGGKFTISRQLSAVLVVGSLSLLLVSIFSGNIWADWSLAGNNFVT